MHDAKERPAARRVTPEKLKRDAKNLRTYARFVIVLKEGETGVEIIDNGVRRAQGLPYAKIISVLGPAQHDGKHLSESNLLEIGYSRARPYASTELSNKNGSRSHRRWFLKQRPRVRLLLDGETVRIYPYVVECMQAIVEESRADWKNQESWYVKDFEMVERGIHFTVRVADKHMHRQLVLEDVGCRKKKYISWHAKFTQSLIRKYQFLHYTPKQLKSFAKARRVAELLSQGHYTPFYRTVLCRHFEDGSHERILLDLIVKAFDIDVSLTELEARAFEPSPISLPPFENLGCYRPPKQPTIHARGATVFEIFLEKEYRLSLEERSQHGQQTDDEVPF